MNSSSSASSLPGSLSSVSGIAVLPTSCRLGRKLDPRDLVHWEYIDVIRGRHEPEPGYRLWAMPELPEMEIAARRLGEALAGETIESAVAPGINALKTFDPPLSALDGATIEGVRRRGKLLMLDAGGLTLLMHLMSAGRLQLFPKHASLRDRTARVGLRLPEGRELRLREFGTQAARVGEAADAGGARRRRVARQPRARRRGPTRRDLARPAATRRGRCTRCCATSRWSPGSGARGSTRSCTPRCSRPSSAATTSPRRRPSALRAAMVSELGRVLDVYEEQVASCRCPRSSRSPPVSTPTRASPARAARRVLEAVFYEDYVMTYCPHCQTEGRVLKDRRLSRLLK